MSANYPFIRREFMEPKLFQKIFKSAPKENAFIEINNLFFAKRKVREVTVNDFEKIESKYKINVYKEFNKEFLDIYKRYLVFCLEDDEISEDEATDLNYLRFLLDLGNDQVESVHNEAIEEVYKSKVEFAIRDGKLSTEEKELLKGIQNKLKLPDEIANKLYGESAKKLLENVLASNISDHRLSPSEEEELNSIAQSLGVSINYDEKTSNLLSRYKLFWLIENDKIPIIRVDIALRNHEECYFSGSAKWYEYRTVTKRFSYSGPTARIKIMTGVYWRMGDLSVGRVSDDVMTLIDKGMFYLTNKRIIFLGTTKNISLNLNRVLGFTPCKNGVEIQKDSGRNPFLEFSENIDIFSLILQRLLKGMSA